MTVPDRPGPPGDGLFVLVAGWPGSGKSTLAAALATRLDLPLLAKDEIKEALMDALGRPQTVADSQRLGPVIEVDTSADVDLDQLLARLDQVRSPG